MSRRATELIGKPVVAADTGAKLGTVADLLLNDQGSELVGFVLKRGFMKSEDVLTVDAVQTLGTDAIVSRTATLVSAREWRDRQTRVPSSQIGRAHV